MNLIKYYLKDLTAFSGMRLYMNLAGMVLVTLLDGLGLLVLIPLLGISGIINIQQGLPNQMQLFAFLGNTPKNLALLLILGFFVMIVISQNILERFITIQNTRLQQEYTRKIKVETYKCILEAKWSFFLMKRRSDLINVLTSELARVIYGINLIMQFFTACVFTFIQIGLAIWLSPLIASFVLIFGLIIFFILRISVRKSGSLGYKTSKYSQEYLGGITDQFNGIKDIKSNSLENSRLIWFQKIVDKLSKEQVEYTKIRTTSQLFFKVGSTILMAIFIFLALKLFHASLGQLLLIILIFSRLWPRFISIQSNIEQIVSTLPAFKALTDLRNESSDAKELKSLEGENEGHKFHLNKEIVCDKVMFKYTVGEAPTLTNVNLIIPANKMTAIVGHSGAGKSTLIDVIMGLLKPLTGQIMIDGQVLTEQNLLAYRKSISYVPQDSFLFNGTIRDNLLMINPSASEEELWQALNFSSAKSFVRELPLGLDTLIGDRGIRLSGGERQRLVLARAILKNPSILILDEATSALDTENENKIQSAIDQLKGNMTIIVIAHRLSTIRNADQVVVLEKGKVIQKGQYGQLANDSQGKFSVFLKRQQEISG